MTQVAILGTYHFEAKNIHYIEPEIADMLSPQKQAEIKEVIEALARFQPTKIALEVFPNSNINKSYTNYREENQELEQNERQQLGFRLAATLKHKQLYPINHMGNKIPFGQALEYAEQHDSVFLEWFQQSTTQWETEANHLQKTATVREILRLYNQPKSIAANHALYIATNRLDAGGSFIGADVLSGWYDRNIRIFANLQHITEPEDRVLVIYGQGHTSILQELVRGDATMALVDILDFL